jgi:hypothetical protein
MLPIPDADAPPFEVWCDASGFAIGAVLIQSGRPVAYEARTLTSAERNYTVGERELLAVVHALTVWRCYLEGVSFRVMTDHAPNTFLPTKAQLSRRQARWSEFLQRFGLSWHFKPGVINIADPVSRTPALYSVPITFVSSMSHERSFSDSREFGLHTALTGFVSSLTSPTTNLLSRIIKGYASDPLFQSKELLTKVYSQNPVHMHNHLWMTWFGALVVPDDEQLRRDIVAEAHNPASCGHGGVKATTDCLRPHYFWTHGGKTFNQFVKHFVQHCVSCQVKKSSSLKKAGLLQPLQPATALWLSVGIDFATRLPLSTFGNDCILVCVDRFAKAVYFAACKKTIAAQQFALLMFQTVYRLHGIPLDIVSDRGTLFTSHLWKELQRLLGAKLRISTAHHPESNGQTERANRVLQEVLRHVVNSEQSNWDIMLAGVELTMNNSVRRSIGESPLMLSHGREAVLPFNMHLMPKVMEQLTDEQLENAIASNSPLTVPMTAADESRVPATKRLHGRMAALHAKTRQTLAVANQWHKHFTDMHRREVEYKVGDKGLLSTRNINLYIPDGATKKLMPKCIGPFDVLARLGTGAFRLKLPSKSTIHVSLLHTYKSDGSCQPPLPPDLFLLNGEAHWMVDKIIDHEWRLVNGRPKLYYLISWEGFPSENDTYEPEENLVSCSEPLALYKDHLKTLGRTLDPSGGFRKKPPKINLPPPPRPDTIVTRSGRMSQRRAVHSISLRFTPFVYT